MKAGPAGRAWAGVFLAWAVALRADEGALDVQPLLEHAVMTAATRAAGREAGLALDGLAAPRAAVGPAPGDSEVALVSLVSIRRTALPTQWLLRLRLAALGNASDPSAGRVATFYTSVGDTFAFHAAARASVDLDIVGPVAAADAPGAAGLRHNQVAVSPDFLMLDLARAAAAAHRIHAAAHTVPFTPYSLGVSSAPFPAAVAAANRARLARFHLTEEDRRSFAGSLPALAEFLGIIRGTPGLEAILRRVIEKPSLLDLVRHGKEDPNFAIVYAEPVAAGDLFWRRPGDRRPLELMVFDLMLFGKKVLKVALLAAEPRPPLEATAGILGAVAWGPTERDQAVVVRVLAARTAP